MLSRIYSKKESLEIRRLERENTKLKEQIEDLEKYKRKVEHLKKQQAARTNAKKDLKAFVNYKSYRNIDRRFWPKVLCQECKHLERPKGKAGNYRCGLHKFQASRWGNCCHADKKELV